MVSRPYYSCYSEKKTLHVWILVFHCRFSFMLSRVPLVTTHSMTWFVQHHFINIMITSLVIHRCCKESFHNNIIPRADYKWQDSWQTVFSVPYAFWHGAPCEDELCLVHCTWLARVHDYRLSVRIQWRGRGDSTEHDKEAERSYLHPPQEVCVLESLNNFVKWLDVPIQNIILLDNS